MRMRTTAEGGGQGLSTTHEFGDVCGSGFIVRGAPRAVIVQPRRVEVRRVC